MITASEARKIYGDATGEYERVMEALEDIEKKIRLHAANKCKSLVYDIHKFTTDCDDGYGSWWNMLTKEGEALVKKLQEAKFKVSVKLDYKRSSQTLTIEW